MATLDQLSEGTDATKIVLWPRRVKDPKTGQFTIRGDQVMLSLLSQQQIEDARMSAIAHVDRREKESPLREARSEMLESATQVELLVRALKDADPRAKLPNGDPAPFAGSAKLRSLPAEDMSWLWRAYDDFEREMSPITYGIQDPGSFNDLLKKLAEEANSDPLVYTARSFRVTFQHTLANLLVDAAMGKSLPTWLVEGFSKSDLAAEAPVTPPSEPVSE
jgi:hypothetical protein